MSDKNKKPVVKPEGNSKKTPDWSQLNNQNPSSKRGIDFETKPVPPKEKPKTDSK